MKTKNELKAQKVTIYGDDAGMQFSQTGHGKRTIQTKVFNIREATIEEARKIRIEAHEENSHRRRMLKALRQSDIESIKNSAERTAYRKFPLIMLLKDKEYKFFLAEVSPKIWDSERHCKVWGIVNIEYNEFPTHWVSYEAIFEAEQDVRCS